jgi:hypothetical protein
MKSPTGIALVLLLAACAGSDATSPAAPPKGSLTITVDGPPGIKPAIVVTGPSGYSVAVTGSLTLSGLELGTYTITASNVVVSASTYAPAVPVLNVTVAAADSQAVATVSYVLASGSLDVAISGLPGATPADVTITGPGGFSRHVTASQGFPALIPGSYSFAASNVFVSGAAFEPTPLLTSVAITASTVPAGIQIVYAPPAPVARVVVSPLQKTFAMIPGLVTPALKLAASVWDSTNTLRPGRLVTWSSDNVAVATVDATGVVAAVGPGTAGITATSGGVSAQAAISVLSLSGPPPIEGSWTVTVHGSSTGWTCNGTGTITIAQPADSGYSPATAAMRGGCSSGGGIRRQSYSLNGSAAFRVALDGTSFVFTIGSCSFGGQITDIFGPSPSLMSGGGHCVPGWPRPSFTWYATKQ